jgi:hypothetical protein
VPRRPKATSRWLTAATWPVGVVLTSWDYMWRSTPLHRRRSPDCALADQGHAGDPQIVAAIESALPD